LEASEFLKGFAIGTFNAAVLILIIKVLF